MRRTVGIVLVAVLVVLGLGSPVSAAPVQHFEGTYSGTEYSVFNGPRCPRPPGGFSTDELYQFTLDLAHGPDWHAEAIACGSGPHTPLLLNFVGQTTITAPGGTLTVSYTVSNNFPIDLPVTISAHITGGTGRFNGASGTCVFTLRAYEAFGPVPPGTPGVIATISQSGDFSCDISRTHPA